MEKSFIVFSIFLIFTTSAAMATLALFTRQSLLVAYMLLGLLLGPWGLKLIPDHSSITQVGNVGIIFLLFLLGLHLDPKELLHMFRKATIVALLSSLGFALMGFVVGVLFHFSYKESLIIGAAMMFSSTIIGLKLLPTTILHHQHTGEVMISVLLLQDLIAIFAMLILYGASEGVTLGNAGMMLVSLPGLIAFAFLVERYVLTKLLRRFNKVQEYIFLLSIGWCLGMAEIARLLGLPEEVGAFIAGVAIAVGPIALFIAESLKPLRDFFLVIFFFSIGAGFNLSYLSYVLVPAIVLASLTLIIKPWLFKVLLCRIGEKPAVAWEVGVRLGQASEFSLLLGAIATMTSPPLLGEAANGLIQAATILTFVVSSYWVVLRYPTPLALTEKMRRD